MSPNLDAEEGPVTLAESPNSTEKSDEMCFDSTERLHPYTSLLTISDLDSCVALENAAFLTDQERASREKV